MALHECTSATFLSICLTADFLCKRTFFKQKERGFLLCAAWSVVQAWFLDCTSPAAHCGICKPLQKAPRKKGTKRTNLKYYIIGVLFFWRLLNTKCITSQMRTHMADALHIMRSKIRSLYWSKEWKADTGDDHIKSLVMKHLFIYFTWRPVSGYYTREGYLDNLTILSDHNKTVITKHAIKWRLEWVYSFLDLIYIVNEGTEYLIKFCNVSFWDNLIWW